MVPWVQLMQNRRGITLGRGVHERHRPGWTAQLALSALINVVNEVCVGSAMIFVNLGC